MKCAKHEQCYTALWYQTWSNAIFYETSWKLRNVEIYWPLCLFIGNIVYLVNVVWLARFFNVVRFANCLPKEWVCRVTTSHRRLESATITLKTGIVVVFKDICYLVIANRGGGWLIGLWEMWHGIWLYWSCICQHHINIISYEWRDEKRVGMMPILLSLVLSYYDANFAVSGGNKSCHFDFQYSQWWQIVIMTILGVLTINSEIALW